MLVCVYHLPSMFEIQKCAARFQKLSQRGIRELVLAIALTAFALLTFQGFILVPRNRSSPLFPVFGGESLKPNGSEIYALEIQEEQKRGSPPPPPPPPVADAAEDGHHPSEMVETDEDPDDLDLDGEESQEDDHFSVEVGNGVGIRKVKDPHGGYMTLDETVDADYNSSADMDEEADTGFKPASSKDGRTKTSLGWGKLTNLNSINSSLAPAATSHPATADVHTGIREKEGNRSGDSSVNVVPANASSSGERVGEINQTVGRSQEKKRPLLSGVALPNSRPKKHVVEKRRRRKKKAAVTTSEMYQMLLKNRGSSCSMIPKWSSPSNLQILEARRQIVGAPIVEDDAELYSPVFRNISMFKRSYELMEKMLKVYIYKEGEQPIFHRPPLTGIYASEGWFMKHMKASSHFVVDDPGKAHLFYIPFSSSHLRFHFYVPGSHIHRKAVDYLNNYVATIAGKYPFWNRTAGADHFLVACHDWATDVTAKAMGNSIRALCNADVAEGFELGKDVSLPETYVRSEKDPLRDLGGRPPSKRPTLAFFAGKMHGYLRPVLLRHWEGKDPDMKVSGPLVQPGGGGRRRGGRPPRSYVQYMKSSRYCICPRGNDVNSPRVVESIFYGCVPVIISDNFVPPFFEVLNWEAFSVVVAEREVPRLKEILVSIPMERYLALQTGVRKVQRHFLWHGRGPARYDLFHMILHSVWLNRVFRVHADL